jgi:hypothetical protein
VEEERTRKEIKGNKENRVRDAAKKMEECSIEILEDICPSLD